jgi:hypothetical protein
MAALPRIADMERTLPNVWVGPEAVIPPMAISPFRFAARRDQSSLKNLAFTPAPFFGVRTTTL